MAAAGRHVHVPYYVASGERVFMVSRFPPKWRQPKTPFPAKNRGPVMWRVRGGDYAVLVLVSKLSSPYSCHEHHQEHVDLSIIIVHQQLSSMQCRGRVSAVERWSKV